MNIFVLSPGRSGSQTFARACAHLTNFTAGHETRAAHIGSSRFDYPDQHIEADNRLTWMLGSLAKVYQGREVFYVDLRRDPEKVALSYLYRWNTSWFKSPIIKAFAQGIVMTRRNWTKAEQPAVCRYYVQIVTDNIENFVQDKPSMRVEIDDGGVSFKAFLHTIGAKGDLASALGTWSEVHNQSRSMGIGRVMRAVRRRLE
jgi:hypothetical protein